jgi:hypothetical protein
MAAADVPPNQPQPESTEADRSPTVPGIEQKSEQEWQTVDFPDAMSVDQLPVVDSANLNQESSATPQTPSTASFLEIAPQVQSEKIPNLESENSTELIQALQECNQDLIERVAELEAELDACQKTLRDQEGVLNQQTQELALAQEQVTRLFGKQELSNQVIQRQQVLVETLTQQWESSQTKMAEMERDCALTQQRYNEQFHELMQTQNTCRDLRSRLHRQQRHTLQFKAALERCLEMQPRWGKHRSQEILQQPELIIDSPSASAVNPEPPTSPETEQTRHGLSHVARTLTTAKALPVQPWSVQSMVQEESIEPLEEIIQIQEENPLYLQSTDIEVETPELEIDSAASSKFSENSEGLETNQPVELPADASQSKLKSIRFPLEEIPQPQLMDDKMEQELERIRAEYGTWNQEEVEADFELDQLESVLSQEPSQPQSIPQSTPEVNHISSNWPAPLIRPQHRRKLASLASIELPKLPKSPQKVPESESFSIEELAEIEPF